jgi:beta-carotene 15,15'-dioxygenase
MIRIALLIAGACLLFFQIFVWPLDTQAQFIAFLAGIVLIGVPHGAADFLVANQNAGNAKKKFAPWRFFGLYLGRLFLFAATFWLFPVAGNILFIFFAAYHFGETDLFQFKTNTILGKLFVMSYGLLILSVILLQHFEEVMPLFQLFPSGKENAALINGIFLYRYYILSFSGILFFATTFIYFLFNRSNTQKHGGGFLVRFALILVILFNLPMLLGFTFYFVIWHSVLSLGNITRYLTGKNGLPARKVTRQIIIYSAAAMAGILLFGLTGAMFISTDAVAGYIFLGLAVLTAPHMPVMHDMYGYIRSDKTLSVD